MISPVRGPRGPIHGRGAADNPPNRFETLVYEDDLDAVDPEDEARPKTQLLRDTSRTILAQNESPDVGFDTSINPYRGCTHGCVWCFARPTHEYLGFSSGLDFETKILVKEDAPELLRAELSKQSWEPRTIAVAGVTDAYQPIERKLRLTRRCIEVLVEFRNPTMIVTKNHLVARDADLLAELARDRAAAVFVSITSLDGSLQRKMEPRASPPERRLEAVRALNEAGVPVGVLVAPVILGLTDHEMPAILAAAAKAGAKTAGYVPLRLPYAVKDLFERWLDDHFRERKEKILGRIRSIRGGKLNDPNFGSRLRGEGVFADELRALFKVASRRAGIGERKIVLSADAFRRPGGSQLALF
jgi:DNA repair photolyase